MRGSDDAVIKGAAVKGLIGFLVVVALIGLLWKWILAAIVIVVMARAVRPAWAEHQADRAAERHRLRELIARAEIQNQWVLAGDPRGTYGRYPPARFVHPTAQAAVYR